MKHQNGIVILPVIIVMNIVMSALLINSSSDITPKANWASFINTITDIRYAMITKARIEKGEQASKGITRTDAQIYNFVAKNGNARGTAYGDANNTAWISRYEASLVTATRIEPEVIKDVLGLSDINTITVNTNNAENVPVSYFITNQGEIFIWPPYEFDGEYYVNETTKVTGPDATSIEFSSKWGNESNLIVKIDNTSSSTPTINGTATSFKVTADTPTIYWKDVPGANEPVGLETKGIFEDKSVLY